MIYQGTKIPTLWLVLLNTAIMDLNAGSPNIINGGFAGLPNELKHRAQFPVPKLIITYD